MDIIRAASACQAKWPMKEEELVCRANQNGIGVYPTSKYWSHPENGEHGMILLNYGGVSLSDIPVAVDLLYQAWFENSEKQ